MRVQYESIGSRYFPFQFGGYFKHAATTPDTRPNDIFTTEELFAQKILLAGDHVRNERGFATAIPPGTLR